MTIGTTLTQTHTLPNGDTVEVVTNYWAKPVPFRSSDWIATLDDYDGAPDAGFQPVGQGETEAQAIADLLEQIADHEA